MADTEKMRNVIFILFVMIFGFSASPRLWATKVIVQRSDREGLLEEFKDHFGRVVAQNYFNREGILLSHKVIDPDFGRVEEAVYDGHGRVMEKTLKEKNGLLLYTEKFNSAQQLVERIDYADLGFTIRKRIFEYNDHRQLSVVRLIKPENSRTVEEVHYRYRADGTTDAFDYFEFFDLEGVPKREHKGTAFYDPSGRRVVHRIGTKRDNLGEVVRRLHYQRSYDVDPDTYVYVGGDNLLRLIHHYANGDTDVRVETPLGRVLSLESYAYGSCPKSFRCMKGRYEPVNGAGVI